MTEVRGQRSEVGKRKGRSEVPPTPRLRRAGGRPAAAEAMAGRGEKGRTGLTERVRSVAKGYTKPFRVRDLIVDADIITREEEDCIYSDIIPTLHKQGELRRVKTGTYEYVQKTKPRTALDVIWHLVRSHRRFDAACIERLSGAKRCTVQKYLLCLTDLGYLRKDGFYHWMLINDTGPDTPRNIGKRAVKLKRQANAVSDRAL